MLQGARHEHMHALTNAASSLDIDIEIRELRKSSDIAGIDAIVLPGGESTAMKIASRSEELYSGIWDCLKENSIPVLGTCAGAILLSNNRIINAEIERNAFGRQRDSFQSTIKIDIDGKEDFPGVFIRAPRFIGQCENAIAWLGNEAVGVLEGNRMALTFHPELTDDLRFHVWLIKQAISNN